MIYHSAAPDCLHQQSSTSPAIGHTSKQNLKVQELHMQQFKKPNFIIMSK